jgi:hypothetical protein
MSCHVVAALPEFGFFLVLAVVGSLKLARTPVGLALFFPPIRFTA